MIAQTCKFPSIVSVATYVFSLLLSVMVNNVYGDKLEVYGVDLELYLKRTDYIDIKLSPDGEKYFAHVRDDKGSYLIFVDRESKKPISSIKAKPGDIIYDYKWISNTEIVYRFGYAVWWSDRPVGRGSLIRHNLKNNRINTVAWGGGYIEILTTQKLDDGKLLAVGRSDSRSGRVLSYIGKIKPSGGRWRVVESLPLPGSNPIASRDGKVLFYNHVDEDFNRSSYYRLSGDEKWSLIKFEDVEDECQIEFVAHDLSKAYLVCDAGELGVRKVYEWDLKRNTRLPLSPEKTLDYTKIIQDPVTGEAAVVVYDPAKIQYSFVAGSDFAQEFKGLLKAFEGQRVDLTSHSEDGNLLVLKVSSDINPGEFYLYDRKKKHADFVMAARSWMSREHLQPMQPLQFTARDGLEFNGYLTRAKDGNDEKLIVYPHGGPHGVREFWGFDEGVQLLAAQGYNVLQVNFRGSGGFGRKFESKGYEGWGESMVDDLIDATAHVKSLGIGASGKVCIMGSSYGAFAALAATVRAPELYRCAVGNAGVYDLPLIYNDDRSSNYWRRNGIFKKSLGDNVEQMGSMSPVNHAKKIKAKVLLIHGKRDWRTPLEQAEKMRAALSAAGNKPQWLVFRDSGHGVAGDKERREYYHAVLKFLKENLN